MILVVRALPLVETAEALQVLLPRTEIFRTLAGQPVLLVARHRGGYPAGDRFGNLILYVEDVIQRAVPLFRPEMVVLIRVNQLGGNAYTVATLADSALDNVACADFLRDLLEVVRLPPEGEA